MDCLYEASPFSFGAICAKKMRFVPKYSNSVNYMLVYNILFRKRRRNDGLYKIRP